MISIRNRMEELDRLQQERDAAVESYVGAIRAVAHYTVALEPSITEPERKYLNELASDVASGEPAFLVDSRASFRALLRDYRDKAAQYIARLREEMASSARALEDIMSALAQSDGDHDSRLNSALARLREIARSPQLATLGAQIAEVADTIADGWRDARNQHQLTVSQLQVEIGVLHKRIDTLEAAASRDSVTSLYTRREMEQRISASPPDYRLLLFRATGIRSAEVQFTRDTAAELAAAFTRRLRNSLPSTAVLGRWSAEEFVAMLDLNNSEATNTARVLGKQLSGPYVCLLGGKAVRPSLQVNIAVVDSAGDTPAHVLQRITGFLSP